MNAKSRLYPSQVETRQQRSQKAKQIATDGENFAARYLEEKGLRILTRNYRAGRLGEIDIIAIDPDEVLVFAEVKTRSIAKPAFGIPELGYEAVGYIKQKKIIAVSQVYLQKTAELNFSRWRYDVLVVEVQDTLNPTCNISHVPDAFR